LTDLLKQSFDEEINLKFLEDIEEEDNIFPDINIYDWK